MKMKKLKFLVPILAFAFFSCDNYLDINDSPNTLTFDKATPNKLLPGAQVSTYRVQVGSMNQLGNVFMNSWTRNVQSYGNGFDKELQLNLDNGFYTAIWDGLYRNIMNFDAIIKYPNPNGQYDLYVAAAKICKAHYMECIVDLYGDAPYSQAWQGNANLTPAYDDDYAIYQALIGELESARNLINNAGTSAEDITPYDVMLGGDMTRWTEFANTIQLRMCLRMSEVTGAKATFRDTKIADIAAGPFLSDNVAVNPGFSSATNDQGSPAFATYCYDVAGNLLQNRTFITMTGHAYKSLQSYASTNWPVGASQEIVPGSGINYANVTDPRSARLYTAGSGQTQRRAVTQGATNVDVGPTTFTVGLPCRLGLAGQFNPYGQSDGTLPSYFACDGFVMTYSESCFLQAEAAVRYPSLFSNEQFWFDEGVTDNFAMRNATLGSYLTTINTKANFGLTASTTQSQKLHAIMYQKWIALIGYNAIQSYIDYVRTGYPVTPLSTTAIQTRKPYRLVYPVSEYVANSANVPNVTAADCFSINSHTPFWVAGAPN
jgi:hypothetical protein